MPTVRRQRVVGGGGSRKRSGGSGLPTSPDNPARMPVPPADPALEPINLTPTLPPEPLSVAALRTNPNFESERAYQINCQRCIWAVEMRARGYNVEALPNYEPNGNFGRANRMYPESYVNMGKPPIDLIPVNAGYLRDYDGPKTVSGKAVEQTILSNFPEGARGVLRLQRISGRSGSGHVVNWEIRGGKVHVYDGQVSGFEEKNGYSKWNTVKDAVTNQSGRAYYNAVWVGRMDNLELNTDLVGKYVKPRG